MLSSLSKEAAIVAQVEFHCQCGGKVQMEVGQSEHELAFDWWGAFTCAVCCERVEWDGSYSDEEWPLIKSALLREHGTWSLWVDGLGSSQTEGLAALRAALQLPLPKFSELKSGLPGPVDSGTRVEMLRLLRSLTKAGLQVRVLINSQSPS